jgi:hypothetical protein
MNVVHVQEKDNTESRALERRVYKYLTCNIIQSKWDEMDLRIPQNTWSNAKRIVLLPITSQ